MSFKVLIFGHRLPGVSPADFKQRYEAHMANLAEPMAGPHFPVSHTRRYIARPDGKNAAVVVGAQSDFDYDVLAEMAFEDQASYKKFAEILSTGENAQRILEDEARFFDRSRVRMVVLGDTEVTERKV
ncbi:hypothetical protein M426DRAFT_14514 [Hypoxylon sp. CI-4A]|nr:hypothetical protein M426DRAFT_14514 [Hypoxylon sp. CI-4A]